MGDFSPRPPRPLTWLSRVAQLKPPPRDPRPTQPGGGFSPLPAGSRGSRWDLSPCPGHTAPTPRWVLWVGNTGGLQGIGWQHPPSPNMTLGVTAQTPSTDRWTCCAGTDTAGQHRRAQGPAAVPGTCVCPQGLGLFAGVRDSVALRGWGPHPSSPAVGWMGHSCPIT